jgi:hypothetical protein
MQQLRGCDLKKKRELRQWLWFIETPLLGMLALVILSIASPLLVGVAGASSYNSQVFLAWLFAAIVLLYAYVPFLALLTSVIRGDFPCTFIPGLFLIYVFVALQLAHAHVSFALFVGDDASFSSVCGGVAAATGPCTMAAQSAWLIFLRMFYYSAVTFVSVGYGDISPQSVASTIAAFPILWSPIFYLGILLGRIVADSSGSKSSAVQ